ncbi:MAG: aldolase [Candidatus Anammoximicrobium sp.]|nr:aldolase [Candidatus Anammoximicrobium sp.]
MIRRSKILAKIRAGRVARVCAVGGFLRYFPRLAAEFRYDGIWVDAEHRVWDPAEASAMLAMHRLADIDCLWRPATIEKTGLYRLLEDGAAGLMIPHVSTPQRAQELVLAVKFPPLGDRGLDGAGLDADFLVGKPADYTDQVNRETFLVVQIETPLALDNVEAIAAVPGVDVLFLGPGDLSLRLGCTPAVNDPVLMDAQKRLAAACRQHGKAWGRPVGSGDDARTVIEMGAQLVVLGGDFGAIYQHLADCAAKLDAVLP